MEKFLQSGDVLMSYELLRSAISLGADISSYAVQSSCVKLLATKQLSGTESPGLLALQNQLAELGVKPNETLWATMINTAVEADNYEEAWRWYGKGRAEGLQPIAGTMHILLKMARQDRCIDTFHRVIEIGTEHKLLPYDVSVVFDVLYTVYMLQRPYFKKRPQKSFNTILSYYSRYCDIQLLDELGVPIEIVASGIAPRQCALQQPSPLVVGMMLMAYVRLHQGHSAIYPCT